MTRRTVLAVSDPLRIEIAGKFGDAKNDGGKYKGLCGVGDAGCRYQFFSSLLCSPNDSIRYEMLF